MLSRRLYDGVGESLDHRGARTLLVVKPESPRELSSALTGRLEISTATTIRHSQPAELDLVEQGDDFVPGDRHVPWCRTTAPFFCSTWALSFFFHARLRVKVMPSRPQ